jgi:hypothetical protein
VTRNVANPVLALPAMHRLAALDPAAREAVEAILADIAADARERANESWRKHKGPMAAYWKAVSVYAGHIRKAMRKLSQEAGR